MANLYDYLTPEQVLKLAKSINGLDVWWAISGGRVVDMNSDYDSPILYNPLTNAEQMLDLVKWLAEEHGYIIEKNHSDDNKWVAADWDDEYGYGQAEATEHADYKVCALLAAKEVIGEKK